jgi:methionine-rich copper-binding protein CopC
MKRILVVSAIATVALATFPAVAHAHPAYKSSSPAANASVAQPPTEVWVEFTEMIEDGSITIYDPCGARADHGDDEMNLTSDRLTTGAHGDRSGTYRVVWSVLGSDGHNTKGEFTFTSTGGDACPGAEEEEEDEPRKERQRERTREDRTIGEDDDADLGSSNGSDRERGNDRSDVRRRDRENDRQRDRTRVKGTREQRDLAQQPTDPSEPTGDKGIWDGIPLGDLMVALGVAALIGAAGGRIYAGIIGPRR